MSTQTVMTDTTKAKIEIEGSIEELHRISIFLENNFVKYAFVDASEKDLNLPEWEESIEWPLDNLFE